MSGRRIVLWPRGNSLRGVAAKCCGDGWVSAHHGTAGCCYRPMDFGAIDDQGAAELPVWTHRGAHQDSCGDGRVAGVLDAGRRCRRAAVASCGELDIMENIGKEPGKIHGSVHGTGFTGTPLQARSPSCRQARTPRPGSIPMVPSGRPARRSIMWTIRRIRMRPTRAPICPRVRSAVRRWAILLSPQPGDGRRGWERQRNNA